MNTEKENSKEQEVTPVQRIKNDWRVLRGRLAQKAIVGNVPYLAFVALLCVIYIGYNQNAFTVQRELNKKSDELKELRWEYMDVKSQMVYAQMETEVIKRAARLGLKPMVLPAFTIERDSATIQN